jgi:3-hydroxyisobutyrate dehydrogenase/2-hydroxy-3-oxopropionate reductase
MTTVAVLGTGRMGSAMARALARAGHELILYNRTEATARTLADELGATVAGEPRAAVADAEIALTMLADGAAVDATYRQPGGVLEAVRDGTLLLEMSTVEPRVSRTLEPVVRAAGGTLLDAPVSGSVALAEQGKLTIMVGGDAGALDRARPVLDALAARVFHLGPTGNGAAMKLAVNTVIFGLDVALAEALVLAELAGVDRGAAWDVFEASAVGAPFVGYKRAAFLDPATTPPAFALELAAKDLRLIADLAAATGAQTAQARTNLEVIVAAADSVGGDRDFADVAEHLRRRLVSAGGAAGRSP